MMVTGSSQSFKCLACKSSQHLQSLESLKLHFQTEHGVVNLLSTAATRAVVPPASFSCHDASCNPGEFVAGCRFYGATGLQEEEMMEHLGSRHGIVFQQDWKHYSSKHCRWALVHLHWYDNFCRCYAKVEYGWGTDIQTLRPKLMRKKGVVPSQVSEAYAHHHVLEEASQENVKSGDESQVLDAHWTRKALL